MIEDRRRKKKLKDYIGTEFLIKIAAGAESFGLQPTRTSARTMMFPSKADNEQLWVYDEFRFISGLTRNKQILNIVRKLGKLAGEKIYSKRIYLFARILKTNPNELEVKTDRLFHELGW